MLVNAATVKQKVHEDKKVLSPRGSYVFIAYLTKQTDHANIKSTLVFRQMQCQTVSKHLKNNHLLQQSTYTKRVHLIMYCVLIINHFQYTYILLFKNTELLLCIKGRH